MTVHVADGLVSPSMCRHISDELTFAYWSRSTVVDADGRNGHVSTQRTSDTAHARYFTSELARLIGDVERSVRHVFGLAAGSLTGWQALRYGPRSGFELHHDDVSGRLGRASSVVVFIETPAGGGELHFPDQDLTIEPAAGTAVAWTNWWPDRIGTTLAQHRVLPVHAGTRVSLVNWSTATPILNTSRQDSYPST